MLHRARSLPLLLLFVSVVASPSAHAAEPDHASTRDRFASGGAPDAPKHVALEITPLGLFAGHYGATLELVPVPHHALVLSGYYARTENGDPEFVQPDPKNLEPVPKNTFSGFGAELGYRYYWGDRGPHGLYLGPSFLVGAEGATFATTTHATSQMTFHDFGGALDLGYQAILGDVVVLGVSAGAQYVHVDKTLPDQNDLFSNASTQSALRPRASITIGYAF